MAAKTQKKTTAKRIIVLAIALLLMSIYIFPLFDMNIFTKKNVTNATLKKGL